MTEQELAAGLESGAFSNEDLVEDGHQCSMPGVPDVVPDHSGEETGLSLADLSQTFLLHSRPQAKRRIYLDFDGHTTSGTIWNSSFTSGADIVTPAYDWDGSPAFSGGEQEAIQNIWKRVAEDFAAFDVDVTTEDPGVEALRKTTTNDDQWGIRVVIGGSSSWYGSAGGVAYVTSFNYSSDTPAFVFEDNLANGAEKYTAEAISHETGHTLGLSHDGTTSVTYYQGHNGWAPIMGNSYYQSLTTFSKGEYSGANNTQDDLAIITSQNGFTYAPDDFGNTKQTAGSFTAAGDVARVNGVIARNTDVDLIRFAAHAGNVSFTAGGAYDPDLDIELRILDEAGQALATAAPADSLAATVAADVAEGTYYLEIKGGGRGTTSDGYSNYGSLGTYAIDGRGLNLEGDVAPPTVAITAPANNAIVSGTVTITAVAADDVGVARVEFFVGTTLVGTSAASPYSASWNTTLTSNGPYEITAKAYDAAGNVATAGIAATASNTAPADTTAPTVSITSPSEGQTVVGTVSIAASAADNVGVTKVDFLVDGVVKGSSTRAPFSYAWSTAALTGSHVLTARAYDAAGNSTASAAVTVTIGADTVAPSAPLTLACKARNGMADCSWKAATDNVGVTGYEVLRDGAVVATSTTLKWLSAKLAKGSYSFTVRAVDAAGNKSGVSNLVSVAIK